MIRKTLLALLAATVLTAGAAHAQRDQIRIVGSSTVYPFTAKVAEQVGRTGGVKTPVIESTGTGGGFKLFCAGVGVQHPDLTNASRAIKRSEIDDCVAHGVTEIAEVKIGFDGIVLASSKRSRQLDISLRNLWLALAKQVPDGKGGLRANPYKRWSDVDPALPQVEIRVLGPPPTSGTRDAFTELALEGGCKTFDVVAAMKDTDEDRYESVCRGIREDGAFVEAGENDNLIVQKLEADRSAYGIFGFSFLDQNSDKIQGSRIDGVAPTFENIAGGDYPVSRPLFIYVKKRHLGVIPGLPGFLAELTSERAWGDDGYLADAGLIPLPRAERRGIALAVRKMTGATGR